MQRSRSSSNIPIPKFKRTLSSENLRNPPSFKRSGSYNHLEVPRPSSRPSATASNRNTILNSQNASASKYGSVSKRTSSTPLRTKSHTRLVSPGQLLTTKKINDKKFSEEQYQKICEYLENKLDAFDPKSLKPLTLNVFVSVITVLFEEIDPRININMSNYKETVLKYLKLFKYPGIVSISMLKSVNTSLSWAPVMAIFGWLVDLIHKLNGYSLKEDKVRLYVLSKFMQTLRGDGTEETFIHYLRDASGFDEKEFIALDEEIKILASEIDEKEKVFAVTKEKEDDAHNKLEKMKEEIKEFKEGAMEARLKKEINELNENLEKKEWENERLQSLVQEMRSNVACQKYSLNDKEKLIKNIENMEYTIELKKQDLDKIRNIKDEYDYEETNLRRRIEDDIHSINGRLLKMKLLLVDVEAKKIQLPDRGFQNMKYLQALSEKERDLRNFKEKLDAKLIEVQETLLENQNQWKEVLSEESCLREESVNLQSEIDKVTVEIERVSFENNVFEKLKKEEINNLWNISPDIEAIKSKKNELQEELQRLEEEMEKRREYYIDIFKNIHEDKVVSSAEMRSIMSNMLEKCSQVGEQKMRQQQIIYEEFMKLG